LISLIFFISEINYLALSAIDIALWDIRCKRVGLPLFQFLGGSKDRVPIYTSNPIWKTEDIVEAQKQGLRGFKVKLGAGSTSDDVVRLTGIRKEKTAYFPIMVILLFVILFFLTHKKG
jgi:L-alanine-DL-glutamate epimerase-like enolase superfamily enzyme